MGYCIAYGFAAVFLQGLGYSNTSLGLIIATGNIIGTALGSVLATQIDKEADRPANRWAFPLLGGMLAVVVLLMIFPQKCAVTSVSYALYIGLCIAINTIQLKMYVDLEHCGEPVNFSFSRGIGSLAYVVLSALLGVLVTKFTVKVIPVCALACTILLGIANVLIDRYFRSKTVTRSVKAEEKTNGKPFFTFMRDNPLFALLLAGNTMFFFAQKTLGTYLVNLVEAVGGNTETLGYMTAYTAAVEVPVMLMYSKLRKLNKKGALLLFAFMFFAIKNTTIALAGTVFMLFVGCTFQAPSYAVYSGAIVDYVDEVIPYEDSAKGQSLIFSAMTVGSVLSCLISGRMIDTRGIVTTKYTAAAMAVLGAVISIIAVLLQRSSMEKNNG